MEGAAHHGVQGDKGLGLQLHRCQSKAWPLGFPPFTINSRAWGLFWSQAA